MDSQKEKYRKKEARKSRLPIGSMEYRLFEKSRIRNIRNRSDDMKILPLELWDGNINGALWRSRDKFIPSGF
jgi:hypothetical protein